MLSEVEIIAAATCDYPGCTKQADFKQDLSTVPEGYHKYWCEEHDPYRRKVPMPPGPVVIEKERIVERVVERPVYYGTRVVRRPGIYGKRPGE